METYEVLSGIRGHHIYLNIWNPSIGEELICRRETSNGHDRYAVSVTRGSKVVGHVPRNISAARSLFLQRKGTILTIVSGSRRYSSDLPQGGLEVPCILKFHGTSNDVSRRLLLPISITTAPEPKKQRKIDCSESEVLGGKADNTGQVPWVTCNILYSKKCTGQIFWLANGLQIDLLRLFFHLLHPSYCIAFCWSLIGFALLSYICVVFLSHSRLNHLLHMVQWSICSWSWLPLIMQHLLWYRSRQLVLEVDAILYQLSLLMLAFAKSDLIKSFHCSLGLPGWRCCCNQPKYFLLGTQSFRKRPNDLAILIYV